MGFLTRIFGPKRGKSWEGVRSDLSFFVEIFYHKDHHNARPNHNCALAGRTGATSFDRREPALWVSAKHCFHGGALSWWRWSFTMSLTTYSSKAQCPNCCQNFHFEQWLFDTLFIIVRKSNLEIFILFHDIATNTKPAVQRKSPGRGSAGSPAFRKYFPCWSPWSLSGKSTRCRQVLKLFSPIFWNV